MENKMKHKMINFFTNGEDLEKYMRMPTSFGHMPTRISDDLVVMQRDKAVCKLDTPIIIGATILDLCKMVIYNFHYNIIKNKYEEKARLLYHDTDSLIYHIETDDIYE